MPIAQVGYMVHGPLVKYQFAHRFIDICKQYQLFQPELNTAFYFFMAF